MPPHTIHLLLDFDSTLTTTSTLPLIYNVGHRLNPSSPPWRSVSQAYGNDYNAHLSSYTPVSTHRKTLQAELEWLQSLREVEQRSTERVRAAGVFCGVTQEDMFNAAQNAVKEREVVMRRGWERLMEKVVMGTGKVAVVSVGWSGNFIRGCLQMAYDQFGWSEGEGVSKLEIGDIDVFANEVVGGEEGKMDRHLEKRSRQGGDGIWTVRDKMLVMEEIVGTSPSSGQGKVVYVGDSPTDLACLFGADVGICIRDDGRLAGEQAALQDTLKRIGIECRYIGEMGPNELRGRSMESSIETQGEGAVLWWARDFDEIYKSALFRAAEYGQKDDAYMSAHIQSTAVNFVVVSDDQVSRAIDVGSPMR
ncbi:MAG: hypothetical protein L6R40_005755 [Gallowayella cf. fulva]|nr:MAG: hypothetical protein L6R40_005755 [Xanthomendoza cf. fulva]